MSMKTTNSLASLLALLGPTIAIQAYGEVYMTETQAAATIFPGLKFEKKELNLSDSDVQKIKKDSGIDVRSHTLAILRAKSGEMVFIDEVLGKHEFIIFATGIDRNGKVKGIEILEYRESYGHEIRRAAWRRQFVGKDKTAGFHLDEDIKNISGATLSSAHVTNGVKRILHTYDLIKTRI